MELVKLLGQYLDVHFLVSTFGLYGVTFIIFAETGLMLGFFLPGDSLLITAGIFASKGLLDITTLCIFLFLAATTGNLVGYLFGKHVGKKLFEKEDSKFFKKHYVKSAHGFYEKHGGKAIIIARFIPIMRTFAPIVAGIADMNFKTFFLYNIAGSLVWAVGLTLAGFFLGKTIPDKYFEPIIFVVIFVSLIPAIWHTVSSKEKRRNILIFLSSIGQKKN